MPSFNYKALDITRVFNFLRRRRKPVLVKTTWKKVIDPIDVKKGMKTKEGLGVFAQVGKKPFIQRKNLGRIGLISTKDGGKRGSLEKATAVADITSATAAEREYMQKYSDFSPVKNSSTGAMEKGFLSGAKRGTTVASEGDRIVFDWSGYTIGYFGRPFEMKGGVKGGAFESDGEYSRAVIGENTIARGIELAMIGMRSGEGKQVLLPYGKEGYLNAADDKGHKRVGPTPTTFSGQRALDFVLDNPRLDRTILVNIKVIRVDNKQGSGGVFVKGD